MPGLDSNHAVAPSQHITLRTIPSSCISSAAAAWGSFVHIPLTMFAAVGVPAGCGWLPPICALFGCVSFVPPGANAGGHRRLADHADASPGGCTDVDPETSGAAVSSACSWSPCSFSLAASSTPATP